MPGYSREVKTVSSVPDEIDAQSLTGQIDGVLEDLDGTDQAGGAAVAVGHLVLAAVDDEASNSTIM